MNRLNAANLPWKEFKDYDRSCFQARRSEYDSAELTDRWQTDLDIIRPRRNGHEKTENEQQGDAWFAREMLRLWLAITVNLKDENLAQRQDYKEGLLNEAFQNWKSSKDVEK